jgi:hypothetical protein
VDEGNRDISTASVQFYLDLMPRADYLPEVAHRLAGCVPRQFKEYRLERATFEGLILFVDMRILPVHRGFSV